MIKKTKTKIKAGVGDYAIGQKIRILRNICDLSQSELAGAVGLSFQQIQKYEQGNNKVSATKLYEIASVCKADIRFFLMIKIRCWAKAWI